MKMKTPDFVADIKVGCKTIEDIKKWLACWAVTYTDECSGECETCEYDVGEKESVGMGGKTLAYIQQLESRLAQVERERDAATKCIENVYRTLDKNFPSPDDAVYCTRLAKISISDYMTGEWRGVCEDNTMDGAE